MSRRPQIPAVFCALALLAVLTAPAGARLAVSYRGLVDFSRMVRTGEPLGEVLARPPLNAATRGAVQPLLDGYAALLPQAVDMLEGQPSGQLRNVADLFPPGSAQPAWVAICRSGRIVAEADGVGLVRLFLPGEEPRAAYREHYPMLRHVLAALAAGSGGDTNLSVRVYAYRHNYAQVEFSLNPRPYVFRAAAFPPPTHKQPLDLAALEEFFRRGDVLTGAALDNGLTLQGGPGAVMTLAGQPVTLADFAVAYRAIFHAGDNAAFISLDPNANPTLASVNFGGLLENTRLGATVLEADKRFKMIGTGLNPNTFSDERAAARQHHSAFLTSAEREFLSRTALNSNWVGTRFWFYPESVELETDPDYQSATLTSARFTADAERQRGDFGDARAFAQNRRRLLAPSIRACIDDLNANYERYAAAFPELRELKNAARLLGICSWLKRGRGNTLDLDALLAVELPACVTPAAKPQMVAANWLARPQSAAPFDTATVCRRMVVDYLTPALDEPAGAYFSDSAVLAACLKTRFTGLDPWPEAGRRPLREFIRTPADLQAVTLHVAGKRAPEQLRRSINTDPEIAAGMAEVQALANALGDSLPADPTAEEQGRRAELYARYRARVTSTNALLDRDYPGGAGSMRIISIGGGINLGPDEFKIRVRPRPAPPRRPSGTPPPAAIGPPANRPAAVVPRPVPPARPIVIVPATVAVSPPARADTRPAATTARRSWSERLAVPNGPARERVYDAAAQTLTITEHTDSGIRRIRGRMTGNRIVFTAGH